ncbi:hypothetical protein DFJ58DRAFT_868309 [Suillus subalutaceus]|uniref:uncharacterized protein n=1 Tax=Suillus subalutaceus TaxID=48586 RepID=UPI001B868B65|nr:uncharacterized protein DFJ58DRAFT_868309 [Suillus subalutaceus]KAG1835323.1 hypothetical protein DFJ58DRAFT_868309 [Suillus subalutaceus]
MHRCNFCLKGNFQSARAVSLHISWTVACKQHMDQLRNHEQATQEATPNNNQPEDVYFDGDIPWEFDGQGDVILEGPQIQEHCGVQVEEVEDEERMWMRFIQSYPGQVAQMLGCAESMFHDIRAQQEAQGLDPWAPFTDAGEWGLVKWLVPPCGPKCNR